MRCALLLAGETLAMAVPSRSNVAGRRISKKCKAIANLRFVESWVGSPSKSNCSV